MLYVPGYHINVPKFKKMEGDAWNVFTNHMQFFTVQFQTACSVHWMELWFSGQAAGLLHTPSLILQNKIGALDTSE